MGHINVNLQIFAGPRASISHRNRWGPHAAKGSFLRGLPGGTKAHAPARGAGASRPALALQPRQGRGPPARRPGQPKPAPMMRGAARV